MIANPGNCIYVSAASFWEIAIERALGRITTELSNLQEAVVCSDFEPFSISLHHAVEISCLPAYHRDPFDRMLIAQCIVESARLVTHDRALKVYGESVMVM